MKTVIGNIVNYINADTVVPHIVNILGAAASGVVIPIFNKVPEGRTEYEDLCQRYMGDSESLLGITQFIDGVNGNIANMFAQTLGGQRPLFYIIFLLAWMTWLSIVLRWTKLLWPPNLEQCVQTDDGI